MWKSELDAKSRASRLGDVVREQLARVLHERDVHNDTSALVELGLVNELLHLVRDSRAHPARLVDLLSSPARVYVGPPGGQIAT